MKHTKQFNDFVSDRATIHTNEKNTDHVVSESNYIDKDTDQKAIKKEQKAIAPLKKHLENISKLLDWWDKYPYADTYSHNMVYDGPAMILNNDLTQLMRKIPISQIKKIKQLIEEGEQL